MGFNRVSEISRGYEKYQEGIGNIPSPPPSKRENINLIKEPVKSTSIAILGYLMYTIDEDELNQIRVHQLDFIATNCKMHYIVVNYDLRLTPYVSRALKGKKNLSNI